MSLLFIPEDEFRGQASQSVRKIRAVLSEKVSTGHEEHAADPVFSLYVPARHAVHKLPSTPVYPWLQRHCVMSELASAENELTLHREQMVLAAMLLYVSAGHGWQVFWEFATTSWEKNPTAHDVQLIGLLLAKISEYFPAVQLVHVSIEVAAVKTENFPCTHPMHTVSCVPTSVSENLPATHG